MVAKLEGPGGGKGWRAPKLKRGSARRRAARALLSLALLSPAGCLEVAECDASFPCDSGQICFDFACTGICTGQEDCAGNLVCVPCETPDASGRDNLCTGDDVTVSGCAAASYILTSSTDN